MSSCHILIHHNFQSYLCTQLWLFLNQAWSMSQLKPSINMSTVPADHLIYLFVKNNMWLLVFKYMNRCGFESCQGLLNFFMWGNYPGSLWNVGFYLGLMECHYCDSTLNYKIMCRLVPEIMHRRGTEGLLSLQLTNSSKCRSLENCILKPNKTN